MNSTEYNRPRNWLPHVIQAILMLLAIAGSVAATEWRFAADQEHRFTVIEETVKNQALAIKDIAATQAMIAQELASIQTTQQKMVDLEAYVHHRSVQ